MIPAGQAQPFFNDAVSSTVRDVKSSAAQIFGLHLVNTTADTAYLQVFNDVAANVSLGTTAPLFCVRVSASAAVTFPLPLPLDVGGKGLSVAGTTTATGNTGAAISALIAYA